MKRMLWILLLVMGLGVAGAQGAVPVTLKDVQAAHQQARLDYPIGYADLAVWRYAYRLGELLVTEAPANLEAHRLLAQIYADANWPVRAWAALDTYRRMGGEWGQSERQLAGRVARQMAFFAMDRGDLEDAKRWAMQAAAVSR